MTYAELKDSICREELGGKIAVFDTEPVIICTLLLVSICFFSVVICRWRYLKLSRLIKVVEVIVTLFWL